MNKLKWILRLITVCCILIPLIVVGYTYKDNPLGLILPPQVLSLMNQNNSNNNQGNGNNSTQALLTQIGVNPNNLQSPQLENITYDNQTGTATLTVNFTNPLTDKTLDVSSFGVNVAFSNGTQLFTVQLDQPLDVAANQTGNITLSAVASSAQGQTVLQDLASGNQTGDMSDLQFSNLNIDVSGIIVHMDNLNDFSGLFGSSNNNSNSNDNSNDNNGNS